MLDHIIEIDGVQYHEYEVDTGKQIATIRERVPTAEELDRREYEIEKQKVIEDIKALNDNILIGEATEADKQARLAEWAALKLQKGWT